LPALDIDDLKAAYGTTVVLDGVSLSVGAGQILGLIGPSGSGKSTVLRVLVGLLKAQSGVIRLDGRIIDYRNPAEVKAARDRFSIVFQQYNLFQNMTVLENVTIAPVKIRERPRKEVEELAQMILQKVGLQDKLKAYPDELSGGQQQRVAIARALTLRPEILLLDEVTAALDPELVSEVLDTIRVLALEGMTMLIVSHEMGFIREVASKVAFMANGKVVEMGAPTQIFDAPTESRTREFVSKIIRH
jgi:polar amino acid transport system ATP-binding protein